ncbi:transposase [Burkholderia pseudomallei]|uniref:transposase n=1 Tax=Burkholderia pseudomallei TaxID=28450 RepID=UPI0009AF3DF5
MKDTAHPERGSATSPGRRDRSSESSKVFIAIERVLTEHQGGRDLNLLGSVTANRSHEGTRARVVNGKRYTDEFKAEAVKQVIELGSPVKDVARRFGVSPWSLHRWIRERRLAPAASPDSPEQSAEIQRLRAELLRVTEERDMLEKAAAYFAKQTA